jgi:hypothetical protein
MASCCKWSLPLQPAAYPGQCPSCSWSIEDFDYAFRYQDLTGVLDHNCLSLRNTQIQTRHGGSLINGLHHWFQDVPTAPVSRFPQYESLVKHQSYIGWDQLIFGRRSTLWATHQSSYLQRHEIHPIPTSHGTGWTIRITRVQGTTPRSQSLIHL